MSIDMVIENSELMLLPPFLYSLWFLTTWTIFVSFKMPSSWAWRLLPPLQGLPAVLRARIAKVAR